uniref:Uncharacterized protein n=1 Tax=Arundo donax TaxID=35708 RepID=A0A0A8ZZ96_ARUDO
MRIARDVIFDEDRGWDWTANGNNGGFHCGSSEFVVEHVFASHETAAATSQVLRRLPWRHPLFWSRGCHPLFQHQSARANPTRNLRRPWRHPLLHQH